MEDEDQTKVCAQCEQVKVLTTQFHRSKNGKDGHMKMCKECYASNKQETARKQLQAMEESKARKAEREKALHPLISLESQKTDAQRAEEAGVTEGEHAAVGRHHEVTVVVDGRDHAHNGRVEAVGEP